MQIEIVRLDQLKLDPKNARSHSPKNLEVIRRSLERFGQQKPIVVDANGLVVAGNGTLAAAQALGWTEIKIARTELTGDEARAYAIADNRSGELAAWDQERLADVLADLQKNPDIDSFVTGFNEMEIERIIRDAAGGTGALDSQDEVPQVLETATTKLGDLWILGEHRLLCGDSTKADDVKRLMGDETAALLSTDPPYCVDYTGKDRPIHDGKPSGKDWSHVYREVDIDDLGTFLDGVFDAVLPVVDQDAAVYIWHAHVQQPVIAATFEKHGLLLHQVIVWVKLSATFGHSYYRWRHEPCAFGWRRGNKPQHGGGALETVWEVDWEGKARIIGNEHPTQKPVRLFEIPMEQHTRPGAIVLEPFSGSGSQIIAAEKLGRRCWAMELSPNFGEVAIRRWEGFTGKSAVLEQCSDQR